jgi:hypothetical protein
VRTLDVVDGDPPAAGTPADLRGDVWTDPQVAHGVNHEDVDIPCLDGVCPAWLVPGEGPTWIVFVHGKGGSRTEGLRALGPAVEAGPGAGHVRSWNVDPRGYERRETAFLACVTAAEPPATCPAG